MSKEKYLRNLEKRKLVVDARSVDNNTNVIHKPKKRKKPRSKRSGSNIGSDILHYKTIRQKNEYEAQRMSTDTLVLCLCLLYLLSNLLACTAGENSPSNTSHECTPAFITQSQECLDQMIEVHVGDSQKEELDEINKMGNPAIVAILSVGLEATPPGTIIMVIAGTYLLIADKDSWSLDNIQNFLNDVNDDGLVLAYLNTEEGKNMLARIASNPVALAGTYALVLSQDGTIIVGQQTVEPSGEGIGNDIDITTALTREITDQLSKYPDINIQNVEFDDGVVFVHIQQANGASFDDIPFPEAIFDNNDGSSSELLKKLVDIGGIVFVGDLSSDPTLLPDGTISKNSIEWHNKFNGDMPSLERDQIDEMLDRAIDIHIGSGEMKLLADFLRKYYCSQHRVVDPTGTITLRTLHRSLIEAAEKSDMVLFDSLLSQIETTQWYYVGRDGQIYDENGQPFSPNN